MSRRLVSLLAWSLCAVALAVAGAGLVIAQRLASEGRIGSDVFYVVFLAPMVAVYPTVGAFLASRKPGNPIGWLLAGAGLCMSVQLLSEVYAKYTLVVQPGALPGGELTAWVSSWVFIPALGLGGPFLLFLFPTGRPPTARWRPIVWVLAATFAATLIGYAFRPGALEVEGAAGIANPFGLEAAGGALWLLVHVGDLLFPVALLVAAASLFARLRDAGTEERQQLKWFVYVASIMVLAFVVATLVPPLDVVWVLGAVALAALPIAVGIAVLKHHLYDIDVIINRTLVYLPLVGILGGLYAASVALFQRMFVALTGDKSDAAIVLTTLVLAGLFTPVRKSLESIVDRRFKPPEPSAGPQDPEDGERVVREADLRAALGPIVERLDLLERRLSAEQFTSSGPEQSPLDRSSRAAAGRRRRPHVRAS